MRSSTRTAACAIPASRSAGTLGGRAMRQLSVSAQLLWLQVAVVAATVVIGAFASYALVSSQIDDQYKQRALALAYAVAATPDIVEAMTDPDPPKTIQPIAEAIRRSVGADFVVVANKDGIRYSHPNPENIGKRVSTDPSVALAGDVYVGYQEGTLGRSVRAKVPIAADGDVLGIVSVGFLDAQLAQKLGQAFPTMSLTVLLALALGIGGSLILARRLDRQTFGLGPREIAGLLEQRDAMLHGIREGVLALDTSGRVLFANDEATRLLGLPAAPAGRLLREPVPDGRVREVLEGRARVGASRRAAARERRPARGARGRRTRPRDRRRQSRGQRDRRRRRVDRRVGRGERALRAGRHRRPGARLRAGGRRASGRRDL